ncbi:MAG TPA: hypothetical protein PK812_11115 [Beijerinckiaceae bacterium]|nr:hypothetical protein [Beijerinckiaceae bacterium]
MLILLDRIPVWMVLFAIVSLGLAPFTPEPHIVEKLKMLAAGTLTRPIDVFDLAFHALPWVVGCAKVMRFVVSRQRQGGNS